MTPNSKKPSYLIVNKINGYTEVHNGYRYLTLVHNDESTDTLKKYEELLKKMKDFITSINSNSDDYDQKYIKFG